MDAILAKQLCCRIENPLPVILCLFLGRTHAQLLSENTLDNLYDDRHLNAMHDDRHLNKQTGRKRFLEG
ncbi:hypothetical protein [Ensifer canadensis]|uniref:hypothetical protein n=1 Tax=Ensifer canadensis TaxID=555315 RepID=UPI0035E3CE9C